MLKFLRKKIKRLRKRARGRKKPHVFTEKTQHFLPEDASNFLFFQFNSGNAQYFFHQDNMMHVHIADTPHYHVAKHSLSKDVKGIEETKSKYIEYEWQ